jgi:hypothetical protein
MDAERWRQIERLYHAALARPAIEPVACCRPFPPEGSGQKMVLPRCRVGARLISEEDRPVPGPNPSTYAFAKVSTQRNIDRVPVP